MPQYDSSSFPLVTTTAPDDRVLFWQDAEGRNARISMEDLLAPLPGSVLPVVNGGTGQSTYTDGQLLIGNSNDSSLTKATLTAGANITISNGPGSIIITAAGAGGTSVPATGDLYSRLVKTISGTITSPVDMRWQSPDVYNIKDFGAVGSDTSTVNGAQGFVLATELVSGRHYVVKNTGGGSSDFTSVGSSSNTPGTEFVATGATVGTGQAYVDDSFAIQAAINAACAKKNGVVYVPSGLWGARNLTVSSTNNPSVAIIGDGPQNSRLQNFLVGNNTNPILTWFTYGDLLKSDGFVSNISFNNYGNRAQSSPICIFNGAQKMIMDNVNCQAMYDCMRFNSSNLHAENLFVYSGTSNNEYSGCCIRLFNSSAALANSIIQITSLLGGTVGETPSYGPPIWISGTATGHMFTNVSVTGVGSKQTLIPTDLTIVSNVCTIDGLDGHTFQVNDYIVLNGMTPSYFNGYFRITGITSTTVTVANANVDSSASVIGFARSVPCSVLVENSDGAQNESSWTGGLIQAAGYPLAALSTAFYFDGRAYGNAGDGYAISGWTVSGAYIDIGRVSVLITGGGEDGTCLTTNRITISNIMSSGNAGDSTSSMLGNVWVEQSPGVLINNIQGSPSLVDAESAGLYVFADSDPTHIQCDGLRVIGCHLGAPAAYNYAASPLTVCKYGVELDGKIDGLSLIGNVIAGGTAPVLISNSAITATSIVKSEGNMFFTGTSEPAAATVIPTVASGTTITLPWNDTINISGTTTVQTINGGWVGREVQLLVASGVTFNTGGNIKAANAVAAGASITLLFDGSYWWKV